MIDLTIINCWEKNKFIYFWMFNKINSYSLEAELKTLADEAGDERPVIGAGGP